MANLNAYLSNIGTQAALLFGFAVGFVSDVPKGTPYWLQHIYYAIAFVCLGSNMYCLLMATLCTILAPTLALTGPKGSIQTAVTGMYEERKWIWRMFILGILAFSADMLIYLWIVLTVSGQPGEIAVAVFCTILFVAIAVVIILSAKRVVERFSDYRKDSRPDSSSGSTQKEHYSLKAEEFLKAQATNKFLDEAPPTIHNNQQKEAGNAATLRGKVAKKAQI